jgi:hypothetical protein
LTENQPRQLKGEESMECLFADGIVNISMTAGVVRIDFGRVVAAPNESNAQPAPMRMAPTHQLAMPVEGFVRALGAQRQMLQQLVSAGVIKAREGAAMATSTQTGSTPPA